MPKKQPSSLIDKGKTIINPENIAEHFNKFFTEIGTNIKNKISLTRIYYTNYFLNPNNFLSHPLLVRRYLK